jgi:hypothetical protein
MMKRGLMIIVVLILLANIADADGPESEQMSSEYDDIDFHEYFQEYFTYESMIEALDYLEAKHSDIMKVVDLTDTIDENNRMGIPSETWEGRQIKAVKVSDGVETEPDYYSDPEEPDILIVAAHHGNEWPGFETAMYFLFYLMEYYDMGPTDNDGDGELNEDPVDMLDNDNDGLVDEDENEARITWLVDNREIWIIPMFNADGVANNKRTNGRTEAPAGPGGATVPSTGVDVNRNYPFHWHMEPDPETGPAMDSSNPQSSVYRGPDDNFDDDGDAFYEKEYLPSFGWKYTPRGVDEDPVDNFDNDNDGEIDEDPDGGFSEPETVAMRNLLKNLDWNNDDETEIVTSISYHTYGGMILYPWGYTVDQSDHEALFNYIANEMAGFNGYEPMVGTELYPVSGELDDWLYGKHDVTAFTFELDSANHQGEIEDMINISRKNLPCNMYIVENAPNIEVLKGMTIGKESISSLDIGLPQINHTQKKKTTNSDFSYSVEVEISNTERIKSGSVYLYYRAGESGDWNKIPMNSNDDEHYKATIPRQSGGKNVYYYFEAKAVYSDLMRINEVIYVTSPKYGQSDPYVYFVDISLGDTAGAIAAMILMMALVFGIIYTGLGKSLKLAIDAEKRKNRG